MPKIPRLTFPTWLLLFFLSALVSCSGSNADKKAVDPAHKPAGKLSGNFSFNTEALRVVADFNTWWNYHYNNINLTEEFSALNADSVSITKEAFLVELTTGQYIPVRTGINEGVTSYKLHRLKQVDPAIGTAMKDDADRLLAQYRMEGTAFPAFRFEDLGGKVYDPQNTRGKILVLKCWFIHCVACVKEFPELNKLVAEFKDHPDVLFVSLAIDQQPALEKFLAAREFRYAVVAGQKDFMMQNLQCTQFPTHLIVDKTGKISKVVNRCDELVPALKRFVTAS